MGKRMKSAAAAQPADLTAAALNLPRSARLRIISALLEKEGDEDAAADYEAAARGAEMDEAPARFVAKGAPRAFLAKLQRDVQRRARSSKASQPAVAA
jgi:hypothetical protein